MSEHSLAAPPRRRWPSSRLPRAGGSADPNAGPRRAGVRASRKDASWKSASDLGGPTAGTPAAIDGTCSYGREKTIALNRRARHEFSIDDTIEAGIVLSGTEIKSRPRRQGQPGRCVRAHRARRSLAHRRAYRAVGDARSRYNHEPKRDRKLLLHRSRDRPAARQDEGQGPDPRSRCGSTSASAAARRSNWAWDGQTLHDRRRDIAERDARRQMERDIAEARRG